MPRRPTVSSLNANSVGIVNAIRNQASADYYQAVPKAEQTTESIRAVGEAICAFQPRMNEFVTALVNRIARVVVTSRMYQNPWAFAKKGVLEMGETIEEIFVDIADVHAFDPEDAAQTVFQRNKPDVKSMFHAMNMQAQYPVTISRDQLKQAFLSLDGVTDLIARIVNSLYSAANYDEFIMSKYILARLALDGSLPSKTITAVADEVTAKDAIISMKEALTKFQFMSKDYTIAGVNNFVEQGRPYVITTALFDARTDVDVLAKAFNIDRANWAGQHVTVDSFAFNAGELDRLKKLLEKDNSYTGISTADNTALATIECIAIGPEFFQIYDVLNEFTEIYNPKGLYWNEFLNIWKIYSASPFENVLMFTSSDTGVTAVTVNGPASGPAGDTYVFTASLSVTDFTNKGVIWSVAAGDGGTGNVTIDQLGRLHVGPDAAGKWTVKATSVADSTKSNTKEFTVS